MEVPCPQTAQGFFLREIALFMVTGDMRTEAIVRPHHSATVGMSRRCCEAILELPLGNDSLSFEN